MKLSQPHQKPPLVPPPAVGMINPSEKLRDPSLHSSLPFLSTSLTRSLWPSDLRPRMVAPLAVACSLPEPGGTDGRRTPLCPLRSSLSLPACIWGRGGGGRLRGNKEDRHLSFARNVCLTPIYLLC